MAEPALDPRLLELPREVLLELGVDLRPYSGRPTRGGCQRVRRRDPADAPQIGREGWARYVYHHPTWPKVQWRGRRLHATRN